MTDEGIAQALLTPSGGVCVPEAQAGHLIPVGHPDPAYALTAREGKGASQRDGQSTLVTVDPFVKVRRAQSVDDFETWESGRPAPTLNAFDNGSESRATVIVDGVRRLTPRECERLMGWPDDHTRWGADGREIADTNRYKMCGNGVAAPVAEWVARRLKDVLADG